MKAKSFLAGDRRSHDPMLADYYSSHDLPSWELAFSSFSFAFHYCVVDL